MSRTHLDAAAQRPGELERARAIGALLVLVIVCTHVPPYRVAIPQAWLWLTQGARFAVPCLFVLVGHAFARAHAGGAPVLGLWQRYAFKLALLFCGWAAFYAIVPPFMVPPTHGYARAVLQHAASAVRQPHVFLTTGGMYHLGTLSALLQGLTLLALSLALRRLWLAVALGALLYAFGVLAGAYRATPIGLESAFYVRNGPFCSALCVALGALLARLPLRRPLLVGSIAAVLGLAGQLSEAALLHRAFDVPLGGILVVFSSAPFALGVALLCLQLPALGSAPGLTRLGRWSVGLYLLHPYVIECLARLPGGDWLAQRPALMAPVVYAVTGLSVVALSRSARLRRWIS